jgi:hypothetical protein
MGIFSFHSVQSRSGAHPASYRIAAEGYFPRGKAEGTVKLTTSLHPVPSSRMVKI